MKNKKSTIGFMLLIAGSLVFTNCTKNKTNTAPDQDSETTAEPKLATTTEAVNVQMIISDIHEIAGYICETTPISYYDATPISIMQGTNVINSSVNTNGGLIGEVRSVTFNNTIGRDGRVRNGTLSFDYSPTILPSIDHYRLPTFIMNVTSTGYSVDGYTVQINNLRIENSTAGNFPAAPNLPSVTNLMWKQTTDVTVKSLRGTDTLKTSFVGTINKEILNTNNTPIPMPAGYATTYTVGIYTGTTFTQFNNSKSYIAYTGEGSGVLADGSTYTFNITSPLTRNMISSPEVYVPFNGVLISSERHPFVTGIASFKPAGKTERVINFGNSGEVVDYNAKVTVDGISYDLDIK